MDHHIRPITIAEQADLAARRFIDTGEPEVNPHEAGSPAAVEWKRRYEIALLRLTAPADAEACA